MLGGGSVESRVGGARTTAQGRGSPPAHPLSCRGGGSRVPLHQQLAAGGCAARSGPLLPSLPGLEQTDQLGSQLGF